MKIYRHFLRALFFYILAASSLGHAAAQLDPYVNGAANWYFWDTTGKTWLLLGKERRKTGEYWYNFGGKKDGKDIIEARQKGMEPSLYTAIREGREETAATLLYLKNDPNIKPFYTPTKVFALQMDKPKEPYTAIYFVRVKDKVDPKDIAAAAQALGPGAHVEKTAWAWVEAKDFLQWAQTARRGDVYKGLDKPLYPIYLTTLQDPNVVQYLFEIIEKGVAHVKKNAAQAAAKKPAPTGKPAAVVVKAAVAAGKPHVQAPTKNVGMAQPASSCIVPYSWTKLGETWILLGLEKDATAPKKYSWSPFCADGHTSIPSAQAVLLQQTGGEIDLIELGHHPIRVDLQATRYHLLPVAYKEHLVIAKTVYGKPNIRTFDWKWVKAEDLVNGVSSFESHIGKKESYELSPMYKAAIQSKEMQAAIQKKIQDGREWVKRKK